MRRRTPAEAEEEAKKFGTAQVDYIYEQPSEELFAGLIPQYISSMLYHAMTESVAAENAARMTAMDSATNNASEMIDALTLHMNRVRQAAITKEIIEIVSGAAAAAVRSSFQLSAISFQLWLFTMKRSWKRWKCSYSGSKN